MRLFVLLLFVSISLEVPAQASYSGFIGKYPITLVAYHYSDGLSEAYYVYDKYDGPIRIDGEQTEEGLVLYEKDEEGNIQATLFFEDFQEEASTVSGEWTKSDAYRSYEIRLTKDFEIGYGEELAWQQKTLLQSGATPDHYFKTIITKEKGEFYARVSGVQVWEKGTDKLLQVIELECQLFGIDNVSIGDYNFDGIPDFSVFEASYAGPNTSSIYILRDPNSQAYTVSDFSGVSLEFDEEAKRIHEHNQCCGGTSHMNATYQVVANKMVLLDKKCTEYNEDKDAFLEVECE